MFFSELNSNAPWTLSVDEGDGLWTYSMNSLDKNVTSFSLKTARVSCEQPETKLNKA